MSTPRTVVLVGPLAAGKTTLGRIVAANLGLPFVDIDDIAWDYAADLGWKLDHLLALNESIGWLASERAWEPVRSHAVVRTLAQHKGSVIAFGAAYTNFTEPEYATAVRDAIAQADEVVHLLPSRDPAESVAILRERATVTRGRDWHIEGHDYLAEWVTDRLPAEVATMTVYTAGRTAAESAQEILQRLCS